MSSTDSGVNQELIIENNNLNIAPGVNLEPYQKTLVTSVLDLFAGRPSLAKMALWRDDATFEDNIARAQGRKEFEAQWYGLQTAFSAIERLSHEVIDGGDPIKMNLKTKYTIKGIEQEKIIESLVEISIDSSEQKIRSVKDNWNGTMPTGAIADAFKRANAVTMPKIVSVPKTAEEDAQRGN